MSAVKQADQANAAVEQQGKSRGGDRTEDATEPETKTGQPTTTWAMESRQRQSY